MTWYVKTALVLANIGALNWGLQELGWNAVDALVGSWNSVAAMIVYYIIALCGAYGLYKTFAK